MKTTRFFISICLMGSLLAAGCGGSKNASKSPAGNDEVEVIMPFSDFRSDKSFFRATASAVSPDMNVAKKIALQNAKSELAGSIQSLLQEVSTAYIQQHGVNATPDLSQKFESMNQVVVSQMLTNITVAREKFFKSKDTNDYRCFVGIEMAKEDVGKGVIDRISQDTKDRIDFDAAQYRKIFDEKTGK